MVLTRTSKPTITSLVADINRLLTEGVYSSDGLNSLSQRFNLLFQERLSTQRSESSDRTLRMSNFGTTCERKLWYSVNRGSTAREFLGHTRLKFLYGDILEELVLSLASEAGHSVEGRQDTLDLYGVIGHRDAVIDGFVVDVKSANGRSFQKYKKTAEEIRNDIWFAPYYTQLQLYLEASKDDKLVTTKNAAGFLAVDQEMGHLQLSLVPKSKDNWPTLISSKKKMLEAKLPPKRAFEDEPDGLSGNRKLCTYCSYCQFNQECHPGLRTFIASTGPKYLTVVKRLPNMVEVTK